MDWQTDRQSAATPTATFKSTTPPSGSSRGRAESDIISAGRAMDPHPRRGTRQKIGDERIRGPNQPDPSPVPDTPSLQPLIHGAATASVPRSLFHWLRVFMPRFTQLEENGAWQRLSFLWLELRLKVNLREAQRSQGNSTSGPLHTFAVLSCPVLPSVGYLANLHIPCKRPDPHYETQNMR